MAKIISENENKLDLKKLKSKEKETISEKKSMKSKQNETKDKIEESFKMNEKSSIIQEVDVALQTKKNGKYKSAIMRNSSKEVCQKPLKMIPNVSLTTCKEKFQNAMNTEEENSKISLTETSHKLLSVATIKLDETPSSDSYTFSPQIKRFNRSDAFLSLALTNDKDDREGRKELMKRKFDDDSESTEKMFPDNAGRKNNANDKKYLSDFIGDKKIARSIKTKIKNILKNDQMLVLEKLESINYLKRTIINEAKSRKALQIQNSRKKMKIDLHDKVSDVSSYDIEGYALSLDFLNNRRPLFPKMKDTTNGRRATSRSKETIDSELSTFELNDKIRSFRSKSKPNVINLFPKFKKVSKLNLKSELILFEKTLYSYQKVFEINKESQLYATETLQVIRLGSVIIFPKRDLTDSISFQYMEGSNIFPPQLLHLTIIPTRANERQKVSTRSIPKFKYGYCKTFELFVVINDYISSYPQYFHASYRFCNNFSFSLSLKTKTYIRYINKDKNSQILSTLSFPPSIRKKSLKILKNRPIRYSSFIEFIGFQEDIWEEQEIYEISLKVEKFKKIFYSGYQKMSTPNVLMTPFKIKAGYKSFMFKRKMREKEYNKKRKKKNLSLIGKLSTPVEKVEKLKIPEVIVSHCDFEDLMEKSREEMHETTQEMDPEMSPEMRREMDLEIRSENHKISYKKRVTPQNKDQRLGNENKVMEKIIKSLKIPEFKIPKSFSNHSCEICNKRFEMKVQLRNHLRTHKKQNASMFKTGSKDLVGNILSTINYNNPR